MMKNKRTKFILAAVSLLPSVALAQTEVIQYYGDLATPTPVRTVKDYNLVGKVREVTMNSEYDRTSYTFVNDTLVRSRISLNTSWNNGMIVTQQSYIFHNGLCDSIAIVTYTNGKDYMGNKDESATIEMRVLRYDAQRRLQKIAVLYADNALKPPFDFQPMEGGFVKRGSDRVQMSKNVPYAEYFYDTDGNLMEIYRGVSKANDGEGSYFFNEGQLVSVDTKNTAPKSLNEAVLSYDENGRLVKWIHLGGGTDISFLQTTTISYNEHGDPIKITTVHAAHEDYDGWEPESSESRTYSYDYDSTGNWIKRTETQNGNRSVTTREIRYY